MNQKQFLISVIAVFVVGVAVFLAFRSGKAPAPPFYNSSTNELPGKSEEEEVGISKDIYTSLVPSGATLSEPTTVVPASPGREEKLRIFSMQVSADGFDPSNIVIKKGDLVHIVLTSIDGHYDFYVPYNGIWSVVKKGETVQISFGLITSGTFGFECRDYCPSGKIIKGSIIALP